MSILIKGMEMPKNCEECNLESFCDLWVLAREMTTGIPHRATIRHSDCPLIEIQPHGRLIDADEFYKDINESILLTDGFKDTFNLWFDEQPTIIEAEGEA